MKINNISIMSRTALDFEFEVAKSVTVFCGEHASLVLDLISEVLGERGSSFSPDSIDDGHFIIHTDVDIEGKGYAVCYIRNADYIGDNRIAVNFKLNSIEFSEDNTVEFLEKRTANKERRPIFVYPDELAKRDDPVSFICGLASSDRQVFVAAVECPEIDYPAVMCVNVQA